MRKTIYSCDLCRKEFPSPEKDLVGFEFAHGSTIGSEQLIVKSYCTVERHWCRKCWKMVKEMVNR